MEAAVLIVGDQDVDVADLRQGTGRNVGIELRDGDDRVAMFLRLVGRVDEGQG